jgi:hypothetical protein
MARQTGPIYLSGTVGGVTFYRMGNGYFARRKTSMNKERFYSDKAFGRSRAAASVFGGASKIASQVNGMLPREKQGHGVIGRLSGAANRLLHEGKGREEVLKILLKEYAGIVPVVAEVKIEAIRKISLPKRLRGIKQVRVCSIGKRSLFDLTYYKANSPAGAPAPT